MLLIVADLLNVFETFLPQLLLYPNPTDPLNGEAAALLMREPEAYNAKVKGELPAISHACESGPVCTSCVLYGVICEAPPVTAPAQAAKQAVQKFLPNQVFRPQSCITTGRAACMREGVPARQNGCVGNGLPLASWCRVHGEVRAAAGRGGGEWQG